MNTNEASTDKILTDLKRVVRDSEELLADSAGVLGEKARELRERLGRSLESAKATCQSLQDKAVESAKATDKVIRDHPYQSIGIAFGIGLLVGVLATRK